ncbi:hypothetical protein SGR_6693 [Streptomyces griseus subsp. griseus NBRC 13350]|uniref:Uncharacterized protein n=1 Tax=Streptomyces griseus subsp. griseus (strain JCM 4626 / CBS 651.72 / NBRC 13350 / KCC S-0626 / ISP 5235) TaxID=455632 RepID=B1VMP7_STRGG|nr:hypothetical protein SGR_6693 [Streptomyces griseus subsp. griseus NBRC 13350]
MTAALRPIRRRPEPNRRTTGTGRAGQCHRLIAHPPAGREFTSTCRTDRTRFSVHDHQMW